MCRGGTEQSERSNRRGAKRGRQTGRQKGITDIRTYFAQSLPHKQSEQCCTKKRSLKENNFDEVTTNSGKDNTENSVEEQGRQQRMSLTIV